MAAVIPMESNPETMSKYLHELGMSNKWNIIDVISLEGEALDWVPQPVLAVILLFPLSDAYEQYRKKQELEIQDKDKSGTKDVFHLKQVLSNICGTIALVHSVANNTQHIELNDGLLKDYLKNAEGLDAAAKGALLENSVAILDAYKDIVNAENSESNENPETADYHFVTFIHKNGFLFELDGRKSSPINHGETTPEKFLDDAAKICRDFIAREPDNFGFNVVALVPVQ